MSTVQVPREQRLVLYGEPWGTYVRLLRLFDERRHVRITYDRGALEIMTLSPEHEHYKHLAGRLIVALTEELGLPVAGYGSMTFKRRRKQRGLEPDQCYWIQNEQKVRGLIVFDFLRHPPPDLVVEVDITRSSLDRLAIYAALKVPEIWRFDGQELAFYILGTDGEYHFGGVSLAFAGLTANEVAGFMNLRGQMDENAIVRQFRDWIRQQKANGRFNSQTP